MCVFRKFDVGERLEYNLEVENGQNGGLWNGINRVLRGVHARVLVRVLGRKPISDKNQVIKSAGEIMLV